MMRRTFIELSSYSMLGGVLSSFSDKKEIDEIKINPNFTSDGLGLTPESYSKLLSQLVKNNPIKADVYCQGEIVSNFENKIAKAFGKEKAIYMPTGTLANHIAIRQHAIRRKRVLVQKQSHVFRDCGDAVQQLSGINLIPLGDNEISFNLEDVERAIQYGNQEKVATGVEAISIETPVRRQHLRQFDFEQIKNISEYAKKNHIAMHLDGARLFGEAVITSRNVQDYTKMFDTVYLSLYKHFNSIAGAMLAGPAHIIDGLHHERRMFGGGLRASWENILVADYFFEGFEKRFENAQKMGLRFLQKVSNGGKFGFKQFDDGTNVYKFYLKEGDPIDFRDKIMAQGVEFPYFNEKENCFLIKLNESILGMDLDELVQVFEKQV